MNSSLMIQVTVHELCEKVGVSEATLVEIIEHGIVDPAGGGPGEWLFDATMVSLTHRAARLHRDLDIDWNAVALVLDLLEERKQLKLENAMLRQRLSRFLQD